MINRIKDHQATTLQNSLSFGPLLAFLAFVYSLIVTMRNMCFRLGLFRNKRLEAPVVSVGNLTTGGTGKTPLVIALAHYFHSRQRSVVVLSRGYQRSQQRDVIISLRENEEPDHGIIEYSGDEPLLIALKSPGTCVAVGSDRYRMGLQALRNREHALVILDDGYQHQQLHRDCNLLLIDVSRPFLSELPLPAGLMREPRSQIKRADAVILTRVGLSKERTARYRHYFAEHYPDLPLFEADIRPSRITDLQTGHELAGGELSSPVYLAFSGIGNPASFRESLAALNICVRHFRQFPDHHHYSDADLEDIIRKAAERECTALITTEKDAVRLMYRRSQICSQIPLHCLAVELKLKDEQLFFRFIEALTSPMKQAVVSFPEKE